MTLNTAAKATRDAAGAKAAVDALAALFNSGTLKFYTGTIPATPATAVTTQTLLGTVTMNATAFGAGTSANPSIATANAITQDSSADANGTATWARALASNGTTVLADLTVGLSGSGADIIMDDVVIVQAAAIAIASFTLSQAAA